MNEKIEKLLKEKQALVKNIDRKIHRLQKKCLHLKNKESVSSDWSGGKFEATTCFVKNIQCEECGFQEVKVTYGNRNRPPQWD